MLLKGGKWMELWENDVININCNGQHVHSRLSNDFIPNTPKMVYSVIEAIKKWLCIFFILLNK